MILSAYFACLIRGLIYRPLPLLRGKRMCGFGLNRGMGTSRESQRFIVYKDFLDPCIVIL